MSKTIFFPILTRREAQYYHNRDGKFYANYSDNYEKIAHDCLHRCVYCDATEKECGGDPFSLDHFRPKSIFSKSFTDEQINHPYNLYLSCQKCNVLKNKDWKGCIETIDGFTFNGKIGYIDRFRDDINAYFRVEESGELASNDANGPGEYMIRKMLLNRTNRVYLRKKRMVSALLNELNREITTAMEKVYSECEQKSISSETALKKISRLLIIKSEFDKLIV
ncbi:HNH endonuclease [Pantoea sp. Cy-640]|jgi:hypothetical protein|uniref:HNH endonuclease n=1 Tax=Pantoea sp. Cy-640 TaxID=2608353 RepID=UPI001419B6F7|nr:hypothetical protein [Pantoea sp. Cy-640]NIG16555.1 hypothetical protein [Pantoea sp. Cy-640]